MLDPDRLCRASETARLDLLAQREPASHWEGRLSSSPLATATAISALVLAEQHGRRNEDQISLGKVYQSDLSELIIHGLHWLAQHQNADGGWGDTDRSLSNVASTMLVNAAFHLTGVPSKYSGMLERAEEYIRIQGGDVALRKRYGRDKTFAVPILTNYALAGLADWHDVTALPFEFACVPQSFFRWLRLPVVSYAIPALVAIGLARFHHAPPLNPVVRRLRAMAVRRSLEILEQMQPASGGFLEATPLTSFVVMSLASSGQAEHPVTRRGVEFLLASVRPDASWPVDTNLATWNSSLATVAMAAEGSQAEPSMAPTDENLRGLDWLLACQRRSTHPLSGAAPGGWAWTDLPGGVPDADDTSAALLALALWRDRLTADALETARLESIERAALAGAGWLLDLQNADGGWPTFCRGWGKLPFDRSAAELTAHALRALRAWQGRWIHTPAIDQTLQIATRFRELDSRIEWAIQAGLKYLFANQQSDGSWIPLWFGNQHHEHEQNPVYGTSRVLLALRDLNRLDMPEARRAAEWLAGMQDASGGWGSGPRAPDSSFPEQQTSVEETAWATEALLPMRHDGSMQMAVEQGLTWLIEAVEAGQHRQAGPVGLYFAKLWYYEDLYPLIFTTSALGRAVSQFGLRSESPASTTLHPHAS